MIDVNVKTVPSSEPGSPAIRREKEADGRTFAAEIVARRLFLPDATHHQRISQRLFEMRRGRGSAVSGADATEGKYDVGQVVASSAECRRL